MYPYPTRATHPIHSASIHPFALIREEIDSDCILLDSEFDEAAQIFVLPTVDEPSDDAEWDEEVLAVHG